MAVCGVSESGYTDKGMITRHFSTAGAAGDTSKTSRVVEHNVAHSAGRVTIRTIVNGPMVLRSFWFYGDGRFERSAPHVREDRCDDYCLVFVRCGKVRLGHASLSATLSSGQCVLVDLSENASAVVTRDTGVTTLRFPRRWLECRIGGYRPATMRVFETDDGWRVALGAAMTEAPFDFESDGAGAASVFADRVAGLLTDMAERASPAGNKDATLRRLRLDLRVSSHEHSLDLARFAKRHGMSTRTLQGLFHAAGTSFTEELLGLRMERAVEILADPRFSHLSVAEVAFSVGFTNASHFGRRFRGAYGIPPGEYRSRYLARAPADAVSG